MFTAIFSAIGETYLSDDDVLWWAKDGKLKGKSPERIAFLRELMESLPSAIEPWYEPESVTFGDEFLGYTLENTAQENLSSSFQKTINTKLMSLTPGT